MEKSIEWDESNSRGNKHDTDCCWRIHHWSDIYQATYREGIFSNEFLLKGTNGYTCTLCLDPTKDHPFTVILSSTVDILTLGVTFSITNSKLYEHVYFAPFEQNSFSYYFHKSFDKNDRSCILNDTRSGADTLTITVTISLVTRNDIITVPMPEWNIPQPNNCWTFKILRPKFSWNSRRSWTTRLCPTLRSYWERKSFQPTKRSSPLTAESLKTCFPTPWAPSNQPHLHQPCKASGVWGIHQLSVYRSFARFERDREWFDMAGAFLWNWRFENYLRKLHARSHLRRKHHRILHHRQPAYLQRTQDHRPSHDPE